jgi:hypothetical protein
MASLSDPLVDATVNVDDNYFRNEPGLMRSYQIDYAKVNAFNYTLTLNNRYDEKYHQRCRIVEAFLPLLLSHQLLWNVYLPAMHAYTMFAELLLFGG